MKNKFIIIFLCGILLFPFNVNSKSKTYGELSQIKYIRTIDGDSIVFNIPGVHPILGEKISIRVKGVDTPEIRSKCKEEKILAVKAKDYVHVAMERAIYITLDNIERGKYFRIIADVMITDRYNTKLNIAPLLIKSNYAVPYSGGKKIDWCKKLKNE
ncbi:MAG: thermonuclease family protein [Proteobacteria bacterium]|nr:thermonuclease family protein [Pseudomonadota bacterium]